MQEDRFTFPKLGFQSLATRVKLRKCCFTHGQTKKRKLTNHDNQTVSAINAGRLIHVPADWGGQMLSP